MISARRPWWQQATALVSLSAGGALTGLSFVPKAPADIASPSNIHVRLMALQQAARPAPADDATLRSAIVNVAQYYLRMAAGKTPAEMEALIWQHDSIDGIDHGQSCAAFASLTLELAAQVVGQQSWVTGGTSYPWPLHEWADVRVDPNPASPEVVSVLSDAEAHHRWHPLGDGYQPQPGDWVLFDGHVEVVTAYSGGVLRTIGGDSLPNFSVNAHEYPGSLEASGVIGFVNNGDVAARAVATTTRGQAQPAVAQSGSAQPTVTQSGSAQPAAAQSASAQPADEGDSAIPGTPAVSPARPAAAQTRDEAAIPGMPAAAAQSGPHQESGRHPAQQGREHMARGQTSPGLWHTSPRRPARGSGARGHGPREHRSPASQSAAGTDPGSTAIPGIDVTATKAAAGSARPSSAPSSPPTAPVHDADAQQAFIRTIAAGAAATQRKYGVPASVTIAQAIDESGWGRSYLATKDRNLFGIKGTGPAGSDSQPTQEYENGRPVTRTAQFRVYQSVAESIDDHGELLATSGYYRQSMAYRRDPNAFAEALTGTYATDPDYGAKLIRLMRRYDLYRYDVSAAGAGTAATTASPADPQEASTAEAAIPGLPAASTPAASTPAAATPAPATPAPAAPTAATPSPAPASTPPAPSMPAAATPSAAARPAAPARAPRPASGAASRRPRGGAAASARTASLYQSHVPSSVQTSFITRARPRLQREEPLYRDVAGHSGVRWEFLAACDWMQCEAQGRFSPVHGERLGTVNPDGTVYRTRSEALAQCCDDLAELSWAVYGIDLTAPGQLSVRDLANVFAAFRWGGLLRLHHTSAMEFPYAVAGLTEQHLTMRWPNIDEPNAPDRPGGKFRRPFGAVPILLGLKYPATV